MDIRIGNKKYRANPAAITLVRYRALYGESFLNHFLKEQSFEETFELLLKLVYVAIETKKPDYNEYVSLAINDRRFFETALTLQKEVMKTSEDAVQEQHDGSIRPNDHLNEFDEFQILGMISICGIPEFVLFEFPFFMVIEIISQYGKLKNIESSGRKAYKKMSNQEMINFYS